MKQLLSTVQYWITAVGGVMGWFLGGMDSLLYALLIFVVVDYITGVAAAIVAKKVSSEIGSKGIAKKVVVFLLVGMAHVIDTKVLQSGSAIRSAVIFFYLSNEGISILENSVNLGIPIPKKLKHILVQIRQQSGECDKDDK